LIALQIEEELLVSARSQYGRSQFTQAPKTQFLRCMAYGTDGSVLARRVAHDAALADFTPSYLELWLDHGEQDPTREQQAQHRCQDQAETNEGNTDHRHVYQLAQAVRFELADICTFEELYTGVATQVPCELTITHIDRVHPADAALQEAIGETARGRA